MKVRIKFAKQGAMKFIGHLDVMRYFQKALRRADIDIAFSEGMSPHMIMSFAAPLGVGLTSDGEYVDIEIKTPITTAEALEKLNKVMADGMTILDFRQIEEGKASKAMSLVAAADYTVKFRKGCEPVGKKNPEDGPAGKMDWQSDISGFFARKSIVITKQTKKGESEVDIRPMIYQMSVNAGVVSMQLATGSVANLKPELVMEAYAKFKGFELPEFALEVNRREVYADLGQNGKRRLVSLNDLGTILA
ncbi:MAG: TIGR03936 family radical SAM-associated protein [Lachnospiraceae bacterium]|nr:TIGR03936 family radical SAM-associated protein [Lachnospiraceae bacterium]